MKSSILAVRLPLWNKVTHKDTTLCLFASIRSALEGPRQEGLTSDNLSSSPVPGVSKKTLQKSASHTPQLINSCNGIQACGDADHLFRGRRRAPLEY